MKLTDKFKQSLSHKEGNQRHNFQERDLTPVMNDLITHFPDAVCLFDSKGEEEDELDIDSILNRLDIAIWSVDTIKQKIVFASNAIEDIYDMSKDEVTIETWKILIHPDDLDYVQKQHASLNTEDKINLHYRIITPKGQTKWVNERAIAVRNRQNQIHRVLGTLANITPRIELQQKLQQMTYYDELTQLPNRLKGRETLKSKIDQCQRSRQSFALFYLNFDSFNRINGTFGFEIGDEVIKWAAGRIHQFIKPYGFFCRLSGDEMLAIIDQQKDIKAIHQLAQGLIDLIKDPFQINGYEIFLTASIGISHYPTDGLDNKSLINHARTALRLAKDLGSGCFQVYSSSLNIETFRSLQLENDLRKAIDNHEFYLEYQPKVDVRTEKAIGAEALIRWKHPVWGNVSPAEFIPVAEASLLIQEIGNYVMMNVIKQVGEWEAGEIPFDNISFNLSAKNLCKHNLVIQIEEYLKKYKVTPSRLEIEITEGAILHNTEIVFNQISKLKALGIKISLDDYGTGYSSIHYLKKYPIDTLKIDRSFIQNVGLDNKDTVIVQSIVDLARGLKKNVVAEGVENREQLDLLKRMGIDEVQGYLYSKSVSPDEMKHLFLLDAIHPKENNRQSNVERRRYFRIKLTNALRTKMTILSISNKEVTLGSTDILVQDLGLGGLRFSSHLRLVPESEALYGFTTTLFEETLHLSGKVVWSHEIRKGIFEYGIEFVIDEYDRDHLAALLNKLSIKLRSNPNFSDGDFIKQKPIAYIRDHFLKENI